MPRRCCVGLDLSKDLRCSIDPLSNLCCHAMMAGPPRAPSALKEAGRGRICPRVPTANWAASCRGERARKRRSGSRSFTRREF